MARTLVLEKVGPIQRAEISFADLTVLVGPQASGKSIALQWLKFLEDTGAIHAQLAGYGLDWGADFQELLDLYFGEGMRSIWVPGRSKVSWRGKPVDVQQRAKRRGWGSTDTVFLIPAQRVLALRDGWPRMFGDYAPGDPYSVRTFSERLRVLMERELLRSDAIFPRANRLKADYRKLLNESVFSNFKLSIVRQQSQRKLMLGRGRDSEQLPYMVWSAGQREFVPLLLGLYWLMPPAAVATRDDLKWIVIEEIEMGLHPRAISVVLLIVLELMHRGYRVCLSTHSPQVLDAVWAMQLLRKHHAGPSDLLELFDAPKSNSLRAVASSALSKKSKVYYFPGSGGEARDISGLDPAAAQSEEAEWGGLLEFSGRSADVVARVVASNPID